LNIDLDGDVPLWIAKFGGHVNVIQALKSKGGSLIGSLIGCDLGRHVCIVASQGNMNLLQAIGEENNEFLSVPNDQGETPLHVAVVRDNFPMVQHLVEMGVPIDRNDVHGNSPYGLAQIYGGEEIRNYLEEKAMLFDQLF
jgi:ankyrin repeat protein